MTKGSTVKEPTTVRLANPVFTGFGVLLTLYWPALILPEALKLVDSGVNPVVKVPPKPSFNVNGVAPDDVMVTVLELMPKPFAPIKAMTPPFTSTYCAVKL